MSKKMWPAVIVLACIVGFGYWQRQSILAWYYVRQLTSASQDNREARAMMVASLEEAALPRVLSGLRDSDATVCSNLQHALFLMAKQWSVADPRTQRLVERLHGEFHHLGPAGREKCLLLITSLCQLDGLKALPPRLTQVVSEMLIDAEKTAEVRGPCLLLAGALVDHVQPGQLVDVCRGMAERGMKDDHADTRIAALQLLLREPMRREKDLLGQAIALLRDTEATVRRAALIALASESDVAREEHLLPLLHDDDAQVQYLCEMGLRKRGLNDDDIKLARMIADPNPAHRMRVFYHLHQRPDMNVAECLRQLSRDAEPAVRAAAVRAAGQYPQLNLSQRLREMAERDPSDTVRQNARFYLRQREVVQTTGR